MLQNNQEAIEAIFSAPTYTKVRFSVLGSAVVDGLVRDSPADPNDTRGIVARRITNTTHGTEFFVNKETEFDSLEIIFE